MKAYNCDKAIFTKKGIILFNSEFENGKEIEIDQPSSVIRSKMTDIVIGKINTAYLTSGMRDIDITYIKAENTWQLFDEYNVYLFSMIEPNIES